MRLTDGSSLQAGDRLTLADMTGSRRDLELVIASSSMGDGAYAGVFLAFSPPGHERVPAGLVAVRVMLHPDQLGADFDNVSRTLTGYKKAWESLWRQPVPGMVETYFLGTAHMPRSGDYLIAEVMEVCLFDVAQMLQAPRRPDIRDFTRATSIVRDGIIHQGQMRTDFPRGRSAWDGFGTQALVLLRPYRDAMRELHRRGFLLCDLGAPNVLVTRDGRLVGGDLQGIYYAGRRMQARRNSSAPQRDGFVAPENVGKRQFTFTKETDAWALGQLLARLVLGGDLVDSYYPNNPTDTLVLQQRRSWLRDIKARSPLAHDVIDVLTRFKAADRRRDGSLDGTWQLWDDALARVTEPIESIPVVVDVGSGLRLARREREPRATPAAPAPSPAAAARAPQAPPAVSTPRTPPAQRALSRKASAKKSALNKPGSALTTSVPARSVASTRYAVSSFRPGHLEVFRLHQGRVEHCWTNAGVTWSTWHAMPPLPGAPVQIAAASIREGHNEVFVVLKDGTVRHRCLWADAQGRHDGWHPGGKSDREGPWDWWLWDAKGGSGCATKPAWAVAAHATPDGRCTVYVATRDGAVYARSQRAGKQGWTDWWELPTPPTRFRDPDLAVCPSLAPADPAQDPMAATSLVYSGADNPVLPSVGNLVFNWTADPSGGFTPHRHDGRVYPTRRGMLERRGSSIVRRKDAVRFHGRRRWQQFDGEFIGVAPDASGFLVASPLRGVAVVPFRRSRQEARPRSGEAKGSPRSLRRPAWLPPPSWRRLLLGDVWRLLAPVSLVVLAPVAAMIGDDILATAGVATWNAVPRQASALSEASPAFAGNGALSAVPVAGLLDASRHVTARGCPPGSDPATAVDVCVNYLVTARPYPFEGKVSLSATPSIDCGGDALPSGPFLLLSAPDGQIGRAGRDAPQPCLIGRPVEGRSAYLVPAVTDNWKAPWLRGLASTPGSTWPAQTTLHWFDGPSWSNDGTSWSYDRARTGWLGFRGSGGGWRTKEGALAPPKGQVIEALVWFTGEGEALVADHAALANASPEPGPDPSISTRAPKSG